jgi:adenosylcobinamide-GDP ribazoletransferase
MRAVRALLAAIAFLTRIPVGAAAFDVDSGAALFPVVGAGLGAAVGGTAYGLARILPPLAAAGIALAVGALLTGALHLDGLADTADAFGAHSRDGALAIMRDHAIGTYGAVALVLDLLVKTAALAALAGRSRVVLEALAAGALSRAVPVVLGFALPSVRAEGAGAVFRVAPAAAIVAVLLAAALAVPAEPLLIPVAAVVALVLGLWFRRWLGGGTGDTLGAATELAETAVLAAAAGFV